MRYQDIDWNSLWQEARRQKSWQKKKSSDWDRKAAGFAERNCDSAYVELFLRQMDIDSDFSILDIGSGPGTLALPLARKTRKVTAVDFSPAMLKELSRRADLEELTNIRTVEASWTDDWQQAGIEPHDVVVCSRALSVDNLQKALARLDGWARKRVYVTDRVGSGPFDPDLFALLDRPFVAGPDYIFTINMLYRMGINPSVDYIELEQSRVFASHEQAMAACRWMFESLNGEEEDKLAAFVEQRLRPVADGMMQYSRRTPVKWALISWAKD